MKKKIENVLDPLRGTSYVDKQIYQANPLIEACKGMDLLEGRLYYLSLMALSPQLSQLNNNEKSKFEKIIFPTADIIKLFGGYGGYHSKLMSKTKRLRDHGITIITGKAADGKPTFRQIGIFNTFEWDPGKGGLLVEFTKDIKPFVFDLVDGHYTRIAGRTMFQLQSVYATRLIELLLQYQGFADAQKSQIIRRNITVEKLRFYLGIPENKYKRMANFKRNVLDEPIKDINTHTAYRMSYEPVKYGHSIISFDFMLDVSRGEEQQPQSISEVVEIKQESKQVDIDPGATVDNLAADIFAVLRRYGVGKTVAARLVKEYPEERIRANISYTLSQKRVKDYGKYITKAVREDYAAERAAFEQLPLFSQMEQQRQHKGDGRKLTAAEQRAADRMNAFWYGDKPAPSEPETEPVPVKPIPAPEPEPAPEDKDRLSVSIATIKSFVDTGREKVVAGELAKLERKGISIDDVRALSVDELEARYKAADAADETPEKENAAPEPVENLTDPEPVPEHTIFDQLEVTPEAKAAADEQRDLLAQFSQIELDMINFSVKFGEPLDDELKSKISALGTKLFFIYRLLHQQGQK